LKDLSEVIINVTIKDLAGNEKKSHWSNREIGIFCNVFGRSCQR